MQRKPARAIGYARVSSVEQAIGTSLQDQQNAIRAAARSRGLEVARMYVEAASAVHEKFERREQIQALMADVRAGDLVIVDKVDRWSRDPEFSYRSIREILKAGAGFFAVGDGCDPSTPEGDTMLNFRVLFAREEHKRIKQRMVGTRKLLRDRGYYVEGLPPWGYRRRQVRGPERNALEIDEEAAEQVRRVFRASVDGKSIAAIAELVGQHRDRVADTLRNRHYLGEVRNAAGEWIPGKQVAIVDPALFVAAGEALSGRRWTGRHPAEDGVLTAGWWLRDVARCASCGAKLCAAYGGRASPTRKYYFRCLARCGVLFLRVDAAEAACAPLLEARLVELRAELARSPAPPASSVPADIGERLAKLQRRRERHLEAFAEGLSTREELRNALGRVDAERTRLDALRAVPVPATREQRRAVLEDVAGVARRWRRADGRVRRGIANMLIRRALLGRDVEPKIEWRTSEELACVKEGD